MMFSNDQVALVPLDELEHKMREKQREFESLYKPAMFEGVPIHLSKASDHTGMPVFSALRAAIAHWVGQLTSVIAQRALRGTARQ
jgi:hypothetical protein